MSRNMSKSIVDKFNKAELDIGKSLKRFENHIGNAINGLAISTLPAERRLENFLRAIRDSNELNDLKSQISQSLKACKVEVCNVNNGLLKFIQLNVNLESSQLAVQLGLQENETNLASVKKSLSKREVQKMSTAVDCGISKY